MSGQTIDLNLVGTFVGTSVEFQALLAEIKQKDKQREELLMNLKVCFQDRQINSQGALKGLSRPKYTCLNECTQS